MARIRTIKPEFWTSEQVVECSRDTRLLFIGIWNFCDDAGRMSLSPRRLKMQIFPGDDDITSANIRGMILELSKNDLVTTYVIDGVEYLQVTGWKHQRIDKAQPSKIPGPLADKSKSIPRVFQERSETEGKGKGREKEKEKDSHLQHQSLDSTPQAPSFADPPFGVGAGDGLASPDKHTKADLDLLEAKLREAAGYENEPAPALRILGPIIDLITEGFSLETEILPVIKGQTQNMTSPAGSWAFFVKSIRRARESRVKARTSTTASAAKPSAIPKDPNATSRESAERKMAKHYGSPKTEIALRKAMMALWCGKDQFGAVKPYTVGAVFPKGWIKHHFSNQQNVIALADECYRSENLSGILNAAGMDERAYYALVDSEAAKFYAAGLTGKEYFDIPENDEPHLPGGDEWPDIPPTLAHDAIYHEVDMDAA